MSRFQAQWPRTEPEEAFFELSGSDFAGFGAFFEPQSDSEVSLRVNLVDGLRIHFGPSVEPTHKEML